MKEKLMDFSALRAMSGCEGTLLRELEAQCIKLGLSTIRDRLGNLIVRKSGKAKAPGTILLSTAVDEPGVLIRGITEEGLLRFGVVGRVDIRTIIGKQVLLGEKKIPGVIGLKPIHLTQREERTTVPEEEDLYIDIGAANKKEAKALVTKGDWGVFDERPMTMGEHYMLLPAPEKNCGIAVLMSVLEMEVPCDVTIAFTVQGQMQGQGAYAAAAWVKPVETVVLTTVETGEAMDGRPEDAPETGKGAVIPAMSKDGIFPPKLVEKLKACGEVQALANSHSHSEAAVYGKVGGGSRAAEVGIPVRYASAPASVVDVRDVEAAKDLLIRYLEKTKEETPWN